MDNSGVADHRVLRIDDRGNVTLEGIAAIGVAFLLIVLVAQASFLVVARNAAATAAEAAARSASRNGAQVAQIEDGLATVVQRTAPGATGLEVNVDVTNDTAIALVEFDWLPPGPHLLPVRVRVGAEVLRGEMP